jgi:beta-glucanase (GH16 family)
VLPRPPHRIAVLAALVAATCAALEANGRPADASPAPRPSARTLIWSDEFSGRAGTRPDSARWAEQTGGAGWGSHQLQYYTARRANSALDGRGHLVIVARRERFRSRDYTSARLTTSGRFAFRYGTVAVRMRIPPGRGYWPAMWMLGTDIGSVGFPACGEIDVVETVGQNPRSAWGSVHGPPDPSTGVGGRYIAPEPLSAGFHVFSAHWTAGAVTFSVDGHPYYTATPASLAAAGQTWVQSKRFFLQLNLAVGGDWPGPPGRHTRFPGRLVVDWVRVWR